MNNVTKPTIKSSKSIHYQDTIKNEIDMIWSVSKGMQMLTSSQLINYQIDNNRYPLDCSQFKQSTFIDYLMNFVEPFLIKMKLRDIKFQFDDKPLLKSLFENEMHKNPNIQSLARDKLCTDFQIYESILYHLLSNAIKFSPSNK